MLKFCFVRYLSVCLSVCPDTKNVLRFVRNFGKQKLNVTFTFPKKCFFSISFTKANTKFIWCKQMLLDWHTKAHGPSMSVFGTSDQKSFFVQLFQKLSTTKRFLMARFTSWRNDFCQTLLQKPETKLEFSVGFNFEFNFREQFQCFYCAAVPEAVAFNEITPRFRDGFSTTLS